MSQNDKLFILYDARGSNIQGDEITAEVISYFEFKDQKVFKIHRSGAFVEREPI